MVEEFYGKSCPECKHVMIIQPHPNTRQEYDEAQWTLEALLDAHYRSEHADDGDVLSTVQ